MVGRSRQDRLDRLIEEVSRGQRDLYSIRDDDLRESVRVALRMHRSLPNVPDEYARLRMRARVMGGLRPRGASLADHAWTALEMLARPAPYIVRSIALSAVVVAVAMGTTVASADALPDDALYPVKLASETVRLALAAAPADRASVEFSIAEHRFDEAERLAATGRAEDALVASAMYTQHVASAAAELAPSADDSGLAQQMETMFQGQRDRAQALATTLSADTRNAVAAQVLATIARSSAAPGASSVQRVATTAANVADQLATVAEDDAHATSVAAAAPARTAPTGSSRSTASPRDNGRATATPRATTAAEHRANEIAKVVRRAANDAKAAAEKTKNKRDSR